MLSVSGVSRCMSVPSIKSGVLDPGLWGCSVADRPDAVAVVTSEESWDLCPAGLLA